VGGSEKSWERVKKDITNTDVHERTQSLNEHNEICKEQKKK
jgi:hypothetical protein